jgi:hypothetical protein
MLMLKETYSYTEEAYLDELWGEEKIYDKNSKPISWDK